MRLFSCGQKPWQDSALSLNTQDGCVAEFCRRSLKGMKDVPPSQFANRKYIVDAARHVSALYGYGEMETPLIEHADLFRRTLGASSDVVQKEMFEFVDKGGTSVVLRPEGTAGIARMFATRESDLVGVECFGENSSFADAEVIAMAVQFLKNVSLKKQPTLLINSLGNAEERTKYTDVLASFLGEHIQKLSPDSRARVESGAILRVLDSKSDEDKVIVAEAPKLLEFLDRDSAGRFETVCAALDDFGISYRVDPYLVRGLDYYCHTIFELVTDAIGAQNAVLAGGRYDGLVESLGGRPVPAVGWAAGIDRLQLLLSEELDLRKSPVCFIVPVIPKMIRTRDISAETYPIFSCCAKVAQSLRNDGIETILRYGQKAVAKQLQTAIKFYSAAAVLFIGEDECKTDTAVLKDTATGELRSVKTGTELVAAVQTLLTQSSAVSETE